MKVTDQELLGISQIEPGVKLIDRHKSLSGWLYQTSVLTKYFKTEFYKHSFTVWDLRTLDFLDSALNNSRVRFYIFDDRGRLERPWRLRYLWLEEGHMVLRSHRNPGLFRISLVNFSHLECATKRATLRARKSLEAELFRRWQLEPKLHPAPRLSEKYYPAALVELLQKQTGTEKPLSTQQLFASSNS